MKPTIRFVPTPKPALLLVLGVVVLFTGCPGLVGQARAQNQATDDSTEFVQLVATRAQVVDSNYLRVPAGTVGLPLGRPDASESLAITTVGLRLDQTFSRQRLELDVTLSDYAHSHFTYLDFTAQNHRLAWRWQVGADWDGVLSNERSQTLSSFADGGNVNIQNLLTRTTNRFNANYRMGGAWRLQTQASQFREARSVTLQQDSNYQTQTLGLGLQHLWPSGASAAYTARTVRGTFLNRVLSAPALLDTGFDQTEHAFSLQWPISGKTSLQADLTHLNRQHTNFAARNFSGVNASASLLWQPNGAWLWQTRWQREVGNFQTTGSNYSVTDRFSLGPVWQVSDKTRISASVQHSRKHYGGNPGLGATLARTETTQDLTLAVAWQVLQKTSLSASVSQGQRRSNQAAFNHDYRSANLVLDFAY